MVPGSLRVAPECRERKPAWHRPQTMAIEGGPDGPQASPGVSAVSKGPVLAPTFPPCTH